MEIVGAIWPRDADSQLAARGTFSTLVQHPKREADGFDAEIFESSHPVVTRQRTLRAKRSGSPMPMPLAALFV